MNKWIIGVGLTLVGGGLCLLLGLLVGIGIGSGNRDACRAELEQSYEAYQNGQEQLSEDLLYNAVGVTCISEVYDEE